MSLRSELIRRLNQRSALIGVFGLGYVGMPLCLAYMDAGYRVLGFDVDPEKIRTIGEGRSFIRHIADARVGRAVADGFHATDDFSRVSELDALILCLPTPLGEHREPELKYIVGTLESILPNLRAGQVISLESTTYPGTTDEVLATRIEAAGFRIGEEVFLVYSPEREDPGNTEFVTRDIPKLVGRTTPACGEVGVALYEQVIDKVVPVSSNRVAEMAKLLENIHRAVNIGLVNEMKIIADRMGIDIYEVIDAAATKPFGFVPYYPGPGLGGHCIPIDPFYLSWKAREYGIHTRFIELAGEVNSEMPDWVLGKIFKALNQRGKAVRGSKVLVLGIAYKKNVDDTRESPSVALMDKLRNEGAEVDYSDPWVPQFPRMRRYRFDLASVPITAETVAGYDVVIVATDHDLFDYDLIASQAQLIVDTRGRYRGRMPNVVQA